MKIKIKIKNRIQINTQIKFHHENNRTDADFRANANTVSKALDHLEHHWVIETTGKNEFVAHCKTSRGDAIVLPTLQSIKYVRYAYGSKTVCVKSPLITSGPLP